MLGLICDGLYSWGGTHGLCLLNAMSTSVVVTSLPTMPVSLQSFENFLLSISLPVRSGGDEGEARGEGLGE